MGVILLCLLFAWQSTSAFAQNQTQSQQQPSQQQPSQQQLGRRDQPPPQPGAPPSQQQLPPNTNSAPIRPANEAQQSAQPQPGAEQQRRQTSPDNIGPRPIQPQTPGQIVGPSAGIAPPQLPDQVPAVAPGYRAPQRPLPSAERVGVNVRDVLPLTLAEAAARGIYDPRITSENYYERRVTPVSSIIGGGQNGSVTQTDLTGSARLGGFTPFAGGSYQVDFSSTRLTMNNQFVSLNPQFPSALTATYTQPLWRGRGFDDNRRRIEIARKNLTLTDAQFRQRAIEIITRVEQAYWDLVFSLRNLDVQIEAVRQARAQSESNERQVAQDLLAPIDIVAANTQVATFEQNVYSAQEAVTRAENTLKILLLPGRTSPQWSQALLPITPVNLEPPRVPLETAVAAAFANRPEIQQLEMTADINRINTRYYRDQTRPQVDLVGTYTSAGLAGTPVSSSPNPFTSGLVTLQQRINELSQLAGLPPLPTNNTGGNTGAISGLLIGDYGQSLSNLVQQNFPTTRVGLRLTLPLFNRTAEAQLGRSLAEGTRILNQREQLEQAIEAEVRNTLQAVRSAEARLAAAASARSSAEQQYESEQRRFQAGLSTVFLVLQRQTELLSARGRELQAQTDLNKAIAEFRRVTGSTLERYHVTLQTGGPSHKLEQRAAPSEGEAVAAGESQQK